MKLKFDESYFLKFRHGKSTQEWQLFYQKQILELQKYIGNKAKICDIGCGLGSFLEECDKVGWLTYGVDISEYAIQEARRRTKARLAVCDIQDGIPFEEEFDAITCFDVIEHLENPEKTLTDIYLNLKKGGILLLTTPNLRSGFWRRISGWQEDKTHISLKSLKGWERLLEETGFKIIILKTTFPILQHRSGMKTLIGTLLAKFKLGSTLLIFAMKDKEL